MIITSAHGSAPTQQNWLGYFDERELKQCDEFHHFNRIHFFILRRYYRHCNLVGYQLLAQVFSSQWLNAQRPQADQCNTKKQVRVP